MVFNSILGSSQVSMVFLHFLHMGFCCSCVLRMGSVTGSLREWGMQKIREVVSCVYVVEFEPECKHSAAAKKRDLLWKTSWG